MKNNSKLCTAVILSFVACLFFGCLSKNKESKVLEVDKNDRLEYVLDNSLSSNDYAWDNKIYRKDGFVPTPEMAVQIADIILSKIYGRKDIEKQQPFSVNLENDIWLIRGYYLDSKYDGGVAYMEIRKSNGEILKVTYER